MYVQKLCLSDTQRFVIGLYIYIDYWSHLLCFILESMFLYILLILFFEIILKVDKIYIIKVKCWINN